MGRSKKIYTDAEALDVLAKYHKKVSRVEKRASGSPQNVRAAAAALLSGYMCEVCGVKTSTELHHIDGHWRNYSPTNLAFHCRLHHFGQHNYNWKFFKENSMSSRVKWTESTKIKLVKLIRSHTLKGLTLKKAYAMVASESKKQFGVSLSAGTIEDRYYKAKQIAPAFAETSAVVVSTEEFIKLYRFYETMNVIISN